MSDRYDYRELRPLFGAKIAPRELSETGVLVRLGLVDLDQCGNAVISEFTERLLTMRRTSKTRIRDLLLGSHVPATLAWDDFAHLGTARDLAARLAASAAGERAGAANILMLCLQLSTRSSSKRWAVRRRRGEGSTLCFC